MKLIKRISDSIAYRLGYEPIKVNVVPKTNSKKTLILTFFNLIAESGLEVKLILDIGANRGGWSKDVSEIFPKAQYHLFEPQEWLLEENLVKDLPNFRVHCQAVSAKPGKMSFTLNPIRDDSSTLRFTQEEAIAKGWEQIDVEVTTVDIFLKENELNVPQILKIDAEGNDLDVLEGAKNILGKTEVILIEAAIVNMNLENTFSRVNNKMEALGYKLFDITDLNRPFQTQVLWLVELAYIKKGGQVDAHYSNYDNCVK